MGKISGKNEFSRYFFDILLSGVVAGALSLLLVYPFDLVRTRLAVPNTFKGPVDCLTTVFRKGGIRDLYRGLGISVFGILVYRFSYFGLYDLIFKKGKINI